VRTAGLHPRLDARQRSARCSHYEMPPFIGVLGFENGDSISPDRHAKTSYPKTPNLRQPLSEYQWQNRHENLKTEIRTMESNANSFTVVCPNCKSEVLLTEALTSQVHEHLEADFKERQALMQQSLAEREKQLAERQANIKKAQLELDTQVAQKLASERSRLVTAALNEAKLSLGVEMQDLRTRLEERQRALQDAQKTELALRKRESALQSRAETLELEVVRKLGEERAKIRDQAREAASEEHSLKLAEKEKLISEMQKQIANLKQKADQGSQQLQGEVLELDIEAQLGAAFPHDQFEPVPKGIRGADILHHVRTSTGHKCGTIIWEAKRTKAWSNKWPGKLKEDQRAAKAELAVMVSLALPDGTRNFGLVDGVWVCDCACMLAVATALRQGLIGAATARLAETGKQGKMEELYQYLCGTEFRQHIEGLVESFVVLQNDLGKERRAMEKIWAARERQIGRALRHTALLYGGIQGIAGGTALPELKHLQLEEFATEEEVSVPATKPSDHPETPTPARRL